ncbi:hypothetical protein HD600_001609 [Microbacterium ginsengiterrae]|uniref:DUF6630 domain-containing protein n=1 Tax=Microbacterium ginsengiterrae TaxID=546115 RepID=A0A7W9FBE6_9MICO|nr:MULTISPECIES: hypothetical protein [Microbacterium]MBB5743112.1 hypothetical protein [Microbacterium ginsengiterrae]
MSAIDDWTRLCELLDDDPEITPAVREAVNEGDDPWDALIDALDDAGALAYLDSEDTGEELAEALPALPRVQRLGIDLDEVGDVHDLGSAIARAEAILAPHDIRLLHIEDPEDEEAYPLIAVSSADHDEAVALIEKLTH